jgi:fido (protein-threonine AMPylation protein)
MENDGGLLDDVLLRSYQKNWDGLGGIVKWGVRDEVTTFARYAQLFRINRERVLGELAQRREVMVTDPTLLMRCHEALFKDIFEPREAGRLKTGTRQTWVVLQPGEDIWGGIDFGAEGDQVMPELRLLSEQIELLSHQVSSLPGPLQLMAKIRAAAFYHAKFEALHFLDADGSGRLGRILLVDAMAKITGAAEPRVKVDCVYYLYCLRQALWNDNLGPLSDLLHRAFLGIKDPVAYVPTPFQIGPRNSIQVFEAQNSRQPLQREDLAVIGVEAPPLIRRWIGRITLEDLPHEGYERTESFRKAEGIILEGQSRELTVGQALKTLQQIQGLQPYGRFGTSRPIPGALFTKWAEQMLAPALWAMPPESRGPILTLCDNLFERSLPLKVEQIDAIYQKTEWLDLGVKLDDVQESVARIPGLLRPPTQKKAITRTSRRS